MRDAIAKRAIVLVKRLAGRMRRSRFLGFIVRTVAKHPRAILSVLMIAFILANALPGIYKHATSKGVDATNNERGPSPARLNRQRI